MIESNCKTLIIFIAILITACNLSHSDKQQNNGKKNKILAKECINNVIAIDDSLGSIRNHNCETISLSKTIEQYVHEMKKISFNDCPDEFTSAFKKHIDAWIQMTTITNKYPDLRGEMHDLFDIIEQGKHKEEFKSLLKSIWDTWKEVEIAMKK